MKKSVIRSAVHRWKKVPYMLIVGQKEEESGTVSVRSRDDGDLGSQDLDVFVQKAAAEAKDKSGALRKKKGSLPGLVSGR